MGVLGHDAAEVLAYYWRHGYDWRKAEARLNECPQFTTEIDGQNFAALETRTCWSRTHPDAETARLKFQMSRLGVIWSFR